MVYIKATFTNTNIMDKYKFFYNLKKNKEINKEITNIEKKTKKFNSFKKKIKLINYY